MPVLIVLVALGLRVFNLGGRSLWLDEALSWDYARQGLPQVLAMATDPHPPLYYVLLHFWLQLGTSEFWLRWPSVLAGVLAVALAYRLGMAWRGPRAGAISALLLATAPLAVWYSQEVRMYGLAVLWGLLSVGCLLLFLSRGHRLAGIGYVVFSLAGLYTHYAMLAVLAGQVVYVLALGSGLRSRRRRLAWLAAQVGIWAGFVPWLPTALAHGRKIGEGDLHALARLGEVLGRQGGSGSAGPGAELLLPLVLIAGLVSAPGLWWVAQRRTWPRAGILAAAGLAYLLLLAISVVPQGASWKRQGLIALPYLLLALGAAWRGRGSTWIGMGLGLVTLFALGVTYLQPKEQWREVASLIRTEARPDDLVIVHADYTRAALDYYYQGGVAIRGAPASSREMDSLVQEHGRIWLVMSHQSYVDPTGRVQSWLESQARPLGRARLSGVEVWLYERRAFDTTRAPG